MLLCRSSSTTQSTIRSVSDNTTMVSSSATNEEWAEGLVGRDWEIFWNDEEENDTKDSMANVKDDRGREDSEDMEVAGDLERHDGSDDGSDGGIIDDWYAGHVLSCEAHADDKVSFKVLFVGDEEVYDMFLDPAKVRPSARGWIKRTKALLSTKSNATVKDVRAWETKLPPDTSTKDDQDGLQSIHSSLQSHEVGNFHIDEGKQGVRKPAPGDMAKILRLRYLLQAQIYLRSRLATIVNHHGSTKVVDGEPNPTESYVDNLTQCCRDLDSACDWYCRSWAFLSKTFPPPPGAASSRPIATDTSNESTAFDEIFDTFVLAGKDYIVSCAIMDVSPHANKRRQHVAPTGSNRRPKRRRKNIRWGNDSDPSLDFIADENDFKSTTCVDNFLTNIQKNASCWWLTQFTSMLQTLSHFVVGPIMVWTRRSCALLGQKEPVANTGSDDVDDDSVESTVENIDDTSEQLQSLYFTVQDVQSCIQAIQNEPALGVINTKEKEGLLRTKLAQIEAMATHAKTMITRIVEDTLETPTSQDQILLGLRTIQTATLSPEHPIFNIEPIEIPDLKLSRSVFPQFLEFRRWLVDAWHTTRSRERSSFIQELTERIPIASSLPNLGGTFHVSHAEGLVSHLTQQIKQVGNSLDTYNSVVQLHSSKAEQRENRDDHLFSIDGVTASLAELAKLPAVFPVEEKLSLRLDLLRFYDKAVTYGVESGTVISFPELEDIHNRLEDILHGSSQTRRRLTEQMRVDSAIENEVKKFVALDAEFYCGNLIRQVRDLYTSASEWKGKTESVILALRMYGNQSVEDFHPSQKCPAMIDIKRIQDLSLEYLSLGVTLPELARTLNKVAGDAKGWSSGLQKTVVEGDITVEGCLPYLQEQRDCRPKGIIMDPTRHVFDALLDLLIWYRRVKETGEALVVMASTLETSSADVAQQQVSAFLRGTVFPILAEGVEAVEAYASSNAGFSQYRPASVQSVQLVEQLYGIRRSARAIVKEKLDSHPLGHSIIARMLSLEQDQKGGYPLFVMLWAHWNLLVADFVSHFRESPEHDDDEPEDPPSTTTLSLAGARELRDKRPVLPCELPSNDTATALLGLKSSEVCMLDRIILDAEQAEREVRELLSASREMAKGSLRKEATVRKHLADLKDRLSALKERTQKVGSVSLCPTLDAHLEHHIKVFVWLIRTFSYPLLLVDEASYSAITGKDDDTWERIPYDVLVSLYDRIPNETEERSGDFALATLRVKELYEAARKWQDEITKNTMISIRGGKRRSPLASGICSPSKVDQEADVSARLQIDKMKKLAQNPILNKVAMPREGAVNGILQSSNEFEVELHNFLGKDYEGLSPDRAPFPDSSSLVGKRGEFILYRLTGSPLFHSLKSSMHSLALLGEDVLASTPGKVTFEWMQQAVWWIERLAADVTTDSPFHAVAGSILVIPAPEARQILLEGEELFLNLPEDLKKTLSTHGIFVSTNKQDKTLRVVLKKDGAHHSEGGTMIRWCPILFECLRSDISKLDTWESHLTKILSEFNAFFSETRSQPKSDETNLYRWYCYREQVDELLSDGQESLVVAPQKGLVVSFQNLLNSIQNYLEKHCRPEKERAFARKWFAQSTSLVDDRSVLLESLLYRRAMAGNDDEVSVPGPPPKGNENDRTFRDSCRSYLERCFLKALATVGLGNHSGQESTEEWKSCCAIKAWEIETTMYERYQGGLGLRSVSDEYRNKARSLRCSLDDPHNASLCLRVLVGALDPAGLVNMSPDQLASRKARIDRAKAEEAALSSSLLTRTNKRKESKKSNAQTDGQQPNGTSITKKTPPGDCASRIVAPEGLTPILKAPTTAGAGTTVAVDGEAAAEKGTGETDKISAALSDDAPTMTKPTHVEAATTPELEEQSSASLMALMRSSAKSSRPPPPPPSLAKSFQNAPEVVYGGNSASLKDRGRRIQNAAEGDVFRIEIVNLRLAFFAAFYLEDESQAGVNNYLPDSLCEKGRLKIDDFSKFLSDKLAGGKWTAIPLRLTTITDQDVKEYKRFYKEYEVKKRIAMFAVGQNTKVFLVTPRFHGAAKASGFLSLPNKTSTYAVVLTKETSLFIG